MLFIRPNLGTRNHSQTNRHMAPEGSHAGMTGGPRQKVLEQLHFDNTETPL